MSDFFDLAPRQRAHRQFTDQAIGDDLIEKILNAAICAPSAENKQPWEFIVVRNNTIKQQIGDIMWRAWDGGAKQWSASRLDTKLLENVDHGMRGGIAKAPVLIVVCGNTARCVENTLAASVFPAVQNLLLAATALGLGSALTTIATHYQGDLQNILALPASVKAMAVVPLGYPAKTLGKSKRNAIATCTHRDQFGHAWSKP